MQTVLTIAGSDCSGGAGIQADIKTITMQGTYAMSAITSLTAQNTTGVYGIADTEPEFLKQQLDCIFTDIFPDAVKIGMVSKTELIHVIADALKRYGAKNIVLDPVMVSTSGARLLREEAEVALRKELIPLASLITPNIPEAEALSGIHIETPGDMVRAAGLIAKSCPGAILIKGGHDKNTANDLFFDKGKVEWFYGEKIDNPNTHGTGCTLSSAIASNLAKGFAMEQSIRKAKDYLTEALQAGLNLGKGDGPLMHNYRIAGIV
jgi:hydroxymethylpyrimidine/phosphomethylpyrimidine kinase